MKFMNVIRLLVLIIFIGLLVSPLFNCNSIDPENSMNAIYLEEPKPDTTLERFKFIYKRRTIVRSGVHTTKGHWLTVYEDTKQDAVLLIIQDDNGVYAIYK